MASGICPFTRNRVGSVDSYTKGWGWGPPFGVVYHFTAGCGDDLAAVFNSRNVSAHFGIRRDGSADQYVDAHNQAWHAEEANHRFYGIETVALPGSCEITRAQQDMLARITRWLRDFAKSEYGSTIPFRHVAGAALTSGLKCHYDGLAPGSNWNTNRHWDGGVEPEPSQDGYTVDFHTPLNWKEFLAALKGEEGGVSEKDVLNAFNASADDQLQAFKDFVLGCWDAYGSGRGRHNTAYRKAGFDFAIDLRTVAAWARAQGAPSAQPAPPIN